MRIFDLMNLKSEAYQNREKNVFFQNELFKTRIIDLKPGGRIGARLMGVQIKTREE